MDHEALLGYRRLVDNKLVPAVEERLNALQQLEVERNSWQGLKGQLDIFQGLENVNNGSSGIRLKHDLGEGFHMCATVRPDDAFHRLSVDVGSGLFVEMSLREAVAFVSAKLVALETGIRDAREALIAVRADLTTAQAALLALNTGRAR